jgi:hypothetical protein
MRWFAAATVSLVLVGSLYGCSAPSDGAIPVEQGGAVNGTAGEHATAGTGDMTSAGNGGSAATAGGDGLGDAGSSGAPVSAGGDAGSGGDSSPGDSNGGGGTSGGGASGGGSGGTAQGGTGGSGGAPLTIPNAPSGLVLQVASSTSIQVTWTDNSIDESGFNVYWSTTADKPTQPNLMVASDVTTALADTLTTQTPYNFWVESYNGAGASAAVTGTATPVPVPAQPTGLVVTGGATSAVLNWTDAATGEIGYRVFYSTTNLQPGTAQKELPAGTTTYTTAPGELTPYSTYYVWVAAYDAAGNGMAATGTTIVGVAPPAPTGLVVDATESVWYQAVSWVDNSPSTTSYNIYWATGAAPTKPATPNDTVPVGTTSYRMKQEQSASTYTFWVETVNAIGKSAATKGVANAATHDIPWIELYYDDSAKAVRQTMQDTFGLASDFLQGTSTPDTSTGVYGYHAATQAALGGAGSAMDPSISWPITASNIDTTTTTYYQAEYRTPLGSLFSSVMSLIPPAPLVGLTTGATTNLSQIISWTASTNASSYNVYFGTGATQAQAMLFTNTAAATVTIPSLNPGVTYNYWVSAVGAGLGGGGYVGTAATISKKTTGTYLGPNLALGRTAVASSVYGGANASNVNDNDFNSRWQGVFGNEWIYIDLGAAGAKVTAVELVWEAAYSTTFDIQVCASTCYSTTNPVDSWAWTTVYSSPTNNFASTPFYQMIAIPTASQVTREYIRMKSKSLKQQGVSYGPSLYEFEVFSGP